MDYSSLKNKGYYLRIETGTYKNTPHTEYSLTKDHSEKERSTRCYLNRSAATILKAKYGFTVKRIKDVCWLNRPDSIDLKGYKEPMKMTLH